MPNFEYPERHILPNLRVVQTAAEGDLIKVGPFYGIAYRDVVSGDEAPLYVDVIARVRKQYAGQTVTVGDYLTTGTCTGGATTTSLGVLKASTGQHIMAYALETAAAATTTVLVRLLMPPYQGLNRTSVL